MAKFCSKYVQNHQYTFQIKLKNLIRKIDEISGLIDLNKNFHFPISFAIRVQTISKFK